MTANRYGMAPVSRQQEDGDFRGIDASRRSFITKFAAAVFAAPAISTFALDGIAHATTAQHEDGPRRHHHHGNQTVCNQYVHNQTLFNQCLEKQKLQNQKLHNQMLHNQCISNQAGEVPWLPWERDPGWWGLGECLPFDHHHRRRGLWGR